MIQANQMMPFQEEGRILQFINNSQEMRCNKLEFLNKYNFENPTGEHMPIRGPSCNCAM